MNEEPEEWEQRDRKNSQKEEPQPWEIDPEPQRHLVEYENSNRIGFWGGFGYGLLILVLSGILCGVTRSGIPFFLGCAVVLGFAFSPVTRMIFVGYLTIIATIVLVFVVVCGPMFRGI